MQRGFQHIRKHICKCKCKLRNTREAFVFKKLSPSFSANSVFTCCIPAQDRSTVWHREGWAEQVMVFPLSTTLPTVTTYRLPPSSDLFRSRWQKRMAVLSYHIIWDTPLVTDSLYLVICTAYPTHIPKHIFAFHLACWPAIHCCGWTSGARHTTGGSCHNTWDKIQQIATFQYFPTKSGSCFSLPRWRDIPDK